jgi:molecular chaperone GrpE
VSEPIDSGSAPQTQPPGAESVSAAPEGVAPPDEVTIDDSSPGAPEASAEVTAQQRRIDMLSAQLDESARRARETSERLREEHERLLRTAAEFENFKRRAAKEKEDIGKFAIERLLKDFLPVADNLERALDHAEQHDPKVVIDGVRLVQKMLDQAFSKHGLTSFSAVGAAFDPNSHEALMQAESDLAPGTVVSEMAKGYRLHERLVRPAAVVVAKPRAAADDGAGGDAGPGDGNTGGAQA